MEKLCCNCVHYKHGQLENPCNAGNTKVGYLKKGCWKWSRDENEEKEVPTKVCEKCGQVLPITQFYKYKWGKLRDGYTDVCKDCESWTETRRKGRERMELKRQLEYEQQNKD